MKEKTQLTFASEVKGPLQTHSWSWVGLLNRQQPTYYSGIKWVHNIAKSGINKEHL